MDNYSSHQICGHFRWEIRFLITPMKKRNSLLSEIHEIIQWLYWSTKYGFLNLTGILQTQVSEDSCIHSAAMICSSLLPAGSHVFDVVGFLSILWLDHDLACAIHFVWTNSVDYRLTGTQHLVLSKYCINKYAFLKIEGHHILFVLFLDILYLRLLLCFFSLQCIFQLLVVIIIIFPS